VLLAVGCSYVYAAIYFNNLNFVKFFIKFFFIISLVLSYFIGISVANIHNLDDALLATITTNNQLLCVYLHFADILFASSVFLILI